MYSTAKPKPLTIKKKNILRTSPMKNPQPPIINEKKKGKRLFARVNRKKAESNIESDKKFGGTNQKLIINLFNGSFSK